MTSETLCIAVSPAFFPEAETIFSVPVTGNSGFQMQVECLQRHYCRLPPARSRNVSFRIDADLAESVYDPGATPRMRNVPSGWICAESPNDILAASLRGVRLTGPWHPSGYPGDNAAHMERRQRREGKVDSSFIARADVHCPRCAPIYRTGVASLANRGNTVRHQARRSVGAQEILARAARPENRYSPRSFVIMELLAWTPRIPLMIRVVMILTCAPCMGVTLVVKNASRQDSLRRKFDLHIAQRRTRHQQPD